MNILEPIFAIHRIPEDLIADDMPFSSCEMQNFVQK